MLLGKTLKHIRIFHHYSQVDLSGKLGLSRSYISEIESEKKVPTIEVLKKYSEFFKIPISNIMIFAESIGDKGGMNKKFKSLLTGAAVRFFDWVCKDEEKNKKYNLHDSCLYKLISKKKLYEILCVRKEIIKNII